MTQSSKRLFEVRNHTDQHVGFFSNKMVAKEERNKAGKTKDGTRWLSRVTLGPDHDRYKA